MNRGLFKDIKIITKEHLDVDELCIIGVVYFNEKYPDGMEVTLQNLRELRFSYFQFWLRKYDYNVWAKWQKEHPFEPNEVSNLKAIDYLWTKILERELPQ